MKCISYLCHLLLAISILCPTTSLAAFNAPECTPWQETAETVAGFDSYKKGLLWKLTHPDKKASYLFGTIHVADERITNLPPAVSGALNESRVFAMEVLPELGEMMSFASLMYFQDGRRLTDMISPQLFSRVSALLQGYHIPAEAVAIMKPWAAFLTMSYPAEFGKVLDLQLLEIAQKNGAQISGLETLLEQVSIFENLDMEKQLRLLADTTCHYDIMEADFEKMKTLYMARDLAGLYNYSQRNADPDDELYNELMDKLLTRRNYSMAERMKPILDKGDAFIAVGAMHLAGKEGLLNLLAGSGFRVTRVY